MSTKAERKCDHCRVAKQKCNPTEREWNEITKQKCERCNRSGHQCGPNLTQFETDLTSRGQKRKAKPSPHFTAQPTRRLRHDSSSRKGESPFPGDHDAKGASVDAAPFLAFGERSTQSSSQPNIAQHGDVLEIRSRLEVCDELLCIYQYMMHPKQTIFFLEQELAASTKQAHTQDEATTHLALTIQQVLTCAVQYVDETDDSAECILLLLQEAVQRFRRLACVDDHLMGVEIQILQKRIRLVQQGNTYKGKQKDTSSLLGKDRPFHQQTLNMDLNDMLHRLESCSRAISPDTASTASDDRSEGSKQVMKHAGGLMFSRETAMLLAGSPDKQTSITTAISHYTSLKSHAKPRRPAHQGSIHFPALHRAILFGTEQEARSRLQSTERSLESADFFRRNIAHVAAEKGRIQLLENILPALRAKFDTRDCFNLTPLIITVMHGHLESCKLLIEAGFDRKARDSTGHNILSIAIKRRHVGIVEYLLKELDFPPSDSHGQYICSPIRDAIENGDLEICRLLIQCGADVVTPFNEKSPWTLASHKGLDLVAQYINEKIARDCGSDLDADGAPPQPHFPYGSMPPFQTVEVNDHRAPQHYFNSDQMHNMTSYVPNAPFYQPHSTQRMDPDQFGGSSFIG